MTSSLRVLLASLIDYAGLFPPAALEMPEVVRRYDSCRAGPHGWMLGRLIVPVSHLDDLERVLGITPEPSGEIEPRRVSVLVAPAFAETISRIWDFNGEHGACGDRKAVIDSVAVKASTVAEVEGAADAFPAGFELLVEAPSVNAPVGLLEAVARCGATAKLRAGGTAPDQIPTPLGLATAITECNRAGLSFKATAGLHHPLRSNQPLTYDAAPPRAVVHGFLNVLMAAAVIHAGWVDAGDAAGILADTSPGAFRFADDSVAWRGHLLSLRELRAARRFFRSFGSCSFDEPIAGLETLALL